jgi:periplasmic protein TonB
MDANKILQTDILDLLFEGRNKEYGAYMLRKKYQTHLKIALCGTAAFALTVFFSASFMAKENEKPQYKMSAVELIDIVYPPKEKTLEKIKPETLVKKVATEDFVTPRIEKDKDVKKDEMPPDISELDKALIGTRKIEGEDPDGRILKTEPTVTQAASIPEVAEDPEIIQEVVEVEAEFPGGTKAWVKFVSREIERNMDELQEEGKSGSVIAVFIVDREGAVSEVRILPCEQTGPNCAGPSSKLADVALKAIRKGPKWKPAMKNGRAVKAYRKQQITFKLEEG